VATELASVVIGARDVSGLAQFWAAALDWSLTAPGGPRAVVRPPGPGGVALVFVASERPRTHKNRLHLDLAAGPDLAPAVRRVCALGASPADIGQGEVPWRVLADPEGNEFCVLPQTAPDGGTLAAVCQDAADPAGQGRFWAAATGWSVVDRGGWGVRLRSPSGAGPALVMGPPVAPRHGPDRLRLGLRALPGDDPAAETLRLLGCGGTLVSDGRPGVRPWTLADPEGNEFLLRSHL
jgi:predicted enzyme related to lactoylglutathione lyase